MWRNRLRPRPSGPSKAPHQSTLGARHLNGDATEPQSVPGTAQEDRACKNHYTHTSIAPSLQGSLARQDHVLICACAPIVDWNTVASMSPTAALPATANHGTSDHKRPSSHPPSSSHAPSSASSTKRSRRRTSTNWEPRKKKRKKKEELPQTQVLGDFWPIECIVAEGLNEDDGTAKYLVKWEGLDHNGEPYPLEWVQDVTDDALAAWQKERRVHSDAGEEDEEANSLQSSAAAPDSEPRPQRIEVLDSQATGELTSDTQGRDTQNRDSLVLQKIEVELIQRPGFDPSEYRTILVATSSESSQIAESSEASLLSSIQESAVIVIPDSQEPSAFTAQNPGLIGLSSSSHQQIPCTQQSDPREQLESDSAGLESQVSAAAAEIPSRQPDWPQAREDSPAPGLTSFALTVGSPPRENSAQNSSEDLWNSRPLFHASDFQTQEPFNSFGAPTDPANSQPRSQAESFHTPLSSSQSLLSRHPQSGIGSSDILSQAAQIVPHTWSQSSTQRRFFQESGENSNFQDDIVPESSWHSQTAQPQPQSSAHILAGLHGNSRISSSAPPFSGLGSRSSHSHPSPQTYLDKSSINSGIHDTRAAKSASPFPPSAQKSLLDFKTSNFAGSRHDKHRIRQTPILNMENSNPPSERRLTLQERMRQMAQANFGGASAATPPAEVPGPKTAESAAPAPINDDAPPEVPFETADVLHISPALLVPSVELGNQEEPLPQAEPLHFEHEPMPVSEPVFEYPLPPEELPETLDPSNLTMSIEHDMLDAGNDEDGSPSIPTDNMQPLSEHEASPDVAPSVPGDLPMPTTGEPNILPCIDTAPQEYIVTLPLASNLRPQYAEVLERGNLDLVAYNAAFTVPPYEAPDAALIARVDGVFQRLLDICDLPFSLEAIQKMSPEQITKFIRSTHSKYAFVGSLMEHLHRLGADSSSKRILIVARPGAIIDLLGTLLECQGFQACRLQDGEIIRDDHSAADPTRNSWSLDTLMVTVHPSGGDEQYALQSEYDVIIGFDHTFRRDLLPRWANEHPITLRLVTISSIEHINLRISDNIEPLSRKNYLLLALCASLPDIKDGDLESEEAHEVTERFALYILGLDADEFYWDHQEPSESIFEHIAASSQGYEAQSSWPNGLLDQQAGRKRSLVCDPPRMRQSWVRSN